MTTSIDSIRILLVEDEYFIRLAAAEMLHDEGFEVVEARDGTEAVGLLDGPDGFDLLLTDVQMPGPIDGIQVATHARRRHPGIPVVVVSSLPLHAVRLDRLEPRKTFVGKPYRSQALVTTLRHMLEAEGSPPFSDR